MIFTHHICGVMFADTYGYWGPIWGAGRRRPPSGRTWTPVSPASCDSAAINWDSKGLPPPPMAPMNAGRGGLGGWNGVLANTAGCFDDANLFNWGVIINNNNNNHYYYNWDNRMAYILWGPGLFWEKSTGEGGLKGFCEELVVSRRFASL